MKDFYDFAIEDLSTAEALWNLKINYDSIAYHTQQFCEKILKYALLKELGEEVRGHKIVFLAKKLNNPEILDMISDMRLIQDFYFDKRYPSDEYMETTEEELEIAFEVCHKLKIIIDNKYKNNKINKVEFK